MSLRLVVFDIDGTLVDSAAQIAAAYAAGFDRVGRPAPTSDSVRSVIGLSLPLAVNRLAPDAGAEEVDRILDAYRAAYVSGGEPPLFAGAAELLDRLARRDDLLLGVATGKSRRGVDRMLARHGLERMFQTVQTADLHPSKPHPGMLMAALDEVGVGPAHAIMVGDTTYDVEMALAAEVGAVGVAWGYHAGKDLERAGAKRVVPSFAALEGALGVPEPVA